MTDTGSKAPRIVAECWTCPKETHAPWQAVDLYHDTVDAHRVAGHDVRPVAQKEKA